MVYRVVCCLGACAVCAACAHQNMHRISCNQLGGNSASSKSFNALGTSAAEDILEYECECDDLRRKIKKCHSCTAATQEKNLEIWHARIFANCQKSVLWIYKWYTFYRHKKNELITRHTLNNKFTWFLSWKIRLKATMSWSARSADRIESNRIERTIARTTIVCSLGQLVELSVWDCCFYYRTN